LASAIAADPHAQGTLRVSLADDLLLHQGGATLLASGRTRTLEAAERVVLENCDRTPTLAQVDAELAGRLASEGLLRVEFGLPLCADPFGALRQSVAELPAGPPRDRWLKLLDALGARLQRLQTAATVEERNDALQAIGAELSGAGIEPARTEQSLYAARLPINEECRR